MLQIDIQAPKRKPDFVIGGDDPYMLRWYLIPRNPVFNIYYHRILRDDDDRALHDHPWPSFSIVQRGLLRDVRADGATELRRGDCVYREAGDAHRLELINGSADTLFITGAKERLWGFHCLEGWVDYETFDVQGGCGGGY